MRRAELASSDPDLFRELATACGEGYLSLITDQGFPRCLAVNFAARGEAVFFHGAAAGEKFACIKAEPRVGFSVVQPLSYLPSTWSSSDLACPATQLFRSLEIKGRCRVLEDSGEMAAGLRALMEKYQPEGGFRPIEPESPGYRQALKTMAVFRIEPESWTAKVKLLQDLPQAVRSRIMARLTERGEARDLLTVSLMRRYGG